MTSHHHSHKQPAHSVSSSLCHSLFVDLPPIKKRGSKMNRDRERKVGAGGENIRKRERGLWVEEERIDGVLVKYDDKLRVKDPLQLNPTSSITPSYLPFSLFSLQPGIC
ncbi:hypothetical protein Nepgr_014879 [Nepenthes gracilis]|uniref:Uncharacterized protein n=1 Tax=Nepenthes gracilis TaxID=150966 RepID=A0AAD3SKB0_NEPGR|nr:hypothetical protein Nepgr_014879 [Nepenthes gracilis]